MSRVALMAATVISICLAAIPISSAHSNYHYHKSVPKIVWKKATVIATAYVVRHDTGCETYTARTATGTIPERGTVATDPHIFSHGTRFKIPGYGYGIARDTGSGVRGHHIDLAVLTCHAAWDWGRRKLLVLYLPPKDNA
jgi:3D (Asp-Asp-Asp) domain-containing protein